MTIALKGASVLQVPVNDSVSALAKKTSESRPPLVLIRIRQRNGTFFDMIETNQDASGIDYRLRIPFDTDLQIQVVSKDVAFVNQAASFTHDSTQSQQPSFTFNTTGRKP